MPTGYTHVIEFRDLHLREFALRCARGMGATFHMRDESLDVPIRMPEPRESLPKNLCYYQAQLLEAKGMTLAQARVLRDAEADKRERDKVRAAAECATLRQRYETLRAEVLAWQAPTPEHERLKSLMLEQIEQCKIDYEHPYEPPVPPPAEEWLAQHIEFAEEQVRRAEDDLVKETEHLRKTREWIEQLYASLPKETP